MLSKIFFACLSLFLFAPKAEFKQLKNEIAKANEAEEIIVFTQKKDEIFAEKTLPKLQIFCKEKNIKLLENDAQSGLPAEITTTPCIIFQNSKGRSVFSGRYTDWESVVNFVRNSRFLPIEKAENDCRETVFLHQNGRTSVFSLLKITPLTGDLPKNFDQNNFQVLVNQYVKNSLQQFQKVAKACKTKTDRAFYMDMYPYRDKKGIYYLNVALYSQFSCIVPVFENNKKVLQNTDLQALIKEAAILLEKEIFQQLANSQIGDAVSFVGNEIPVKDWETLGFSLPKMSEKSVVQVNTNIEMPLAFKYAGAINSEIPALQFRFFSPLDRYVGEIKNLNGNMKMLDNQHISLGNFETEMLSLTMGNADFDHKIHEKYIKAQKYPKASFHFENIVLPKPFKINEVINIPITGKMDFMGKIIPLTVNTVFTPEINENQSFVLKVSCRFSLNITENYGIKGPDGPKNASENMEFLMNFLLQ